MDMLIDIAATLVAQLQKPTLAFLIGGMVIAGISVRDADLLAFAVPAGLAAVMGPDDRADRRAGAGGPSRPEPHGRDGDGGAVRRGACGASGDRVLRGGCYWQ